jgi:superfamily II DNA or RNA helicase
MKVLIEVGAVRLTVQPTLPMEDFYKVQEKLTFKAYGYQYTPQYRNYGWDGKKTLFRKNQTAPAGCLQRVKRVLEKNCGHTVKVKHLFNYEPRGDANIHGLVLASFQTEAVARALKYRRGIIEAPVRSGKTAIAAALIKSIGHYTTWVVTYGKDLVHQTRKDLEYHLGVPIGVFSESEYVHGQVIVTSYQAISRVVTTYTRLTNYNPFDSKIIPRISRKTKSRNERIIKALQDGRVFIFDECHHVVAPKNRRLLNAIASAGYIIGLSSTPKPDNKRRLEIEAAIGPNIFKVQYETLIKHKRLATPMITVYQLPYVWYTNEPTEYADIYESNIVENIFRNQFIADVSKKLYETGKTSFIMIRNLAHGPLLRALIPGSMFVQGSISSSARADLYSSLQEKRIHCIIATVGKEGLNIPKLDAVINAEGLKSSVTTLQKMRSLTAAAGKKYGFVIDFLDRGRFLNKHSKRRIKIYRKIGNAKFKTKAVPDDFYKMEDSRWLRTA